MSPDDIRKFYRDHPAVAVAEAMEREDEEKQAKANLPYTLGEETPDWLCINSNRYRAKCLPTFSGGNGENFRKAKQ